MTIRMGAREARRNFSELVGKVRFGGETVILESSGKPVAAVVPLDVYERMIAERDARFAVIDRIRAAQPDYPEDEVEADVNEAVEAVRRARAEGRS